MKIELIAIGNELLNGKIQDLNAHSLGSQLFNNNASLVKVHLIEDSKSAFDTALSSALINADVIITSGGLGPTKDDMTKQFLADYFNKKIKHSPCALKITKEHFEKRSRELDLTKIQYDQIPEEFKPLRNSVGYAPGLSYSTEDGKVILATPGVPSEFQAMVQEYVLPLLKNESKLQKHIVIRTWKIPESKIFNELAPNLWEKLEEFGQVSSLPQTLNVDIGIKIEASTSEQLKLKEENILRIINQTELTSHIWHIGSESIEEVIINEASKRNLTFGFAESCTGGLLASKITDIAGSSSVFWGSIISYANEVKMKSLNVKESTLKNHGAVSAQTALEMATGAQENLSVDIAITTTGVAGPGGGSVEKPVGTVGIGISSKFTKDSKLHYFHGQRLALKQRFAQIALFTLLEEIRKHPVH